MMQIMNTIKPGKKSPDLTDEKFGRLTAIRRVDSGNGWGVRWLCECECGNETVVTSSNLRRGTTKSCGCYRNDLLSKRGKEMVGKRFGRLIVTRRAEPPIHVAIRNRPYWLCKCDCGKQTTVLGINLRKGYTTSCGCARK
jgi:hypothetical protein